MIKAERDYLISQIEKMKDGNLSNNDAEIRDLRKGDPREIRIRCRVLSGTIGVCQFSVRDRGEINELNPEEIVYHDVSVHGQNLKDYDSFDFRFGSSYPFTEDDLIKLGSDMVMDVFLNYKDSRNEEVESNK